MPRLSRSAGTGSLAAGAARTGRPRRARPRSALLAACLVMVAGCAGRPLPPPGGGDAGLSAVPPVLAASPSRPQPLDCELLPGTPFASAPLTVALADSVDPAQAPQPRNDAERVVFRHLYETLVTVDCAGRLEPALAESWASEAGGQRWIFTLRRDARFWDGRRLTAADVRTAWTATQRRARAGGCLLPWAWLDAEAASVQAFDERRLAVTLPEPQRDFPLLLAHPAFAVALARGGDAWPLGSGPCRPERGPSRLPGGDLVIACAPNDHGAGTRPPWPRLLFLLRPGATPAALLAGEVDAALLRGDPPPDPGAQTGHALLPLPWDRLYLLLSPVHAAATWRADPGGWSTASARPAATLLFPGPPGEGCPQLAGPAASVPDAGNGAPATAAGGTAGVPPAAARRLLYPVGDAEAARLAAILTAGGDGASEPGEPVGLPARAWELALRRGGSDAYLAVVQRCFPTPCLQLAALLSSAAWLQQEGLAAQGSAPEAVMRSLMDASVALPLWETRPHLAVRPGLVGVRLGYDGTPLFGAAGGRDPAPR